MKIQIKNRFDSYVLFECEVHSRKLALEIAISQKVDLSYANLSSANLRSADLSYANLRSADLSYANLRYADLSSAIGINKHRTTPLLILADQPGNIRAYKLVTSEGIGPFNGSITYEVGHQYEVSDADTNDSVSCGAGINLATLDWCMKKWVKGYKILIVEFIASDIAAIPIATDGKFRVHRCKIVGEKNLKDIGLEENPDA